jgi:hypothetical protein
VYLLIGLAAWQIADRHNFEGDNWRLIYRWPGAAAVAVIALVLVWSAIWDETRDDRAQLTTPRWLPMLLVGVAAVATILHHLGVV